MAAQLSPPRELGFNRPLTRIITKSLTVSNPQEFPIAFKVKTTAPKLYVVRPNSGRVEPGQSTEVSVILQALKEEPPLSSKCKDKFLIQTTAITAEREHVPINDLWNVTDESDETTRVHQQKLRVVFLPGEGEAIPEDVAEQPSIITDPGDTSGYKTIREPAPVTANGASEHPTAEQIFKPNEPITGTAGDEAVKDAVTTTDPHAATAASAGESLAVGAGVGAMSAGVLGALHSVSGRANGHVEEVKPEESAPVAPAEPAAPAPVKVAIAEPEVTQSIPPAAAAEPDAPKSTVESVPPTIVPVLTDESKPVTLPTQESTTAAAGSPAATANFAGVPASEHDKLKAKYAEALSEIEKLKAEASNSSTLRRRTAASASGDDIDGTTAAGSSTLTAAKEPTNVVDGVPVNIVLAIAFAVFLTTYLFF